MIQEGTYINAMAIVCDLEEFQSSFLDKNFEDRRTSIHGVLYKLFQSMDRRDNDLACSNLVDYILVQCLFWD